MSSSQNPSLSRAAVQALETLVKFDRPVSGRRIATAAEISPTTASKALKELSDAGLADSSTAGRATLWSASAKARDLLEAKVARGVTTDHGTVLAPDAARWRSAISTSSEEPRRHETAIILTALPLEYQAVRNLLPETTRERTRTGTRFEIAELHGSAIDWSVCLAEVGMGNVSAAAELAIAIEKFDPAIVLFVGVGAGLKPSDQERGDVVIADHVYNVHSAKRGIEILQRPVSISTTHRVEQLVRQVIRDDEWSYGLRRDGVAGTSPRAELKAIVASESVLANLDDELAETIRTRFNDAAALDMESYGIYESAHMMETPALAIRGISDLLGDKSAIGDREWQPIAASNAAGFAVALLLAADPDALSPHRSAPPATPTPTPPQVERSDPGLAAIDTPSEALWRFASPARVWWRRLNSTNPEAANAAFAWVVDLRPNNSNVSRLLRRPPEWLRNDATGDAWAFLGRWAESHDIASAEGAYAVATERATGLGLDAIAAIHRIRWAIAHVRFAEAANADIARERARIILAEEGTPSSHPVRDFFSSTLSDEVDQNVREGRPILGILGIPSPFTRSTHIDAEYTNSTKFFRDLGESDPDILDELRAEVLLVLAAYRLDSDPASALRIIDQAIPYIPDATSPLLLQARAKLSLAAGVLGASSIEEQTTSLLAEVEQTALIVRDRRRDWGGPTSEALALAGRARLQAGDVDGALRLLLPAPRGRATDSEAENPSIREIAAFAAGIAGDTALAQKLATGIQDEVEQLLVRAVTLSRHGGADDIAESHYRAALEKAPRSRVDQRVRSLLGLARLGVSIDTNAPDNIAHEVEDLRAQDREAADLVSALAALRAGRPRDALSLARQYPGSYPAVQIAAEAAALQGEPKKAIEVLEGAGRRKGDESLLTQAMMLAASAGLQEDASRLAGELLLSASAETQLRALEVKLGEAGQAGSWHEVARIARRLIKMTRDRNGEEGDVASYRWALASAEYNTRNLENALAAMDYPSLLTPRNRMEALLLVSTMQNVASSRNLDSEAADRFLDRAIDVGTAWSDDEEISAAVLSLILFLPLGNSTDISDSALIRARDFQEEFFSRFPATTLIRRIDVSEDLSELTEHIKDSLEPRAEVVRSIGRGVWLGDYPLALLADIAGSGYAESLIKRAVGCHVAVTDSPAAREALTAMESGSVVIDTSAILISSLAGSSPSQLLAQFDKIFLPSSLRDDIHQTRATLNLRSSMTIGWNPDQHQVMLTQVDNLTLEAWATAAKSLVDLLPMVDPLPDSGSRQGKHWDAAIALAREMGLPLWADDVAIRRIARDENVISFGTLDVVQSLFDQGRISETEFASIYERLVEARVVDLPLSSGLTVMAQADDWLPNGYAALMLSRPRLWMPPQEALPIYFKLIRALPEELSVDHIAGWAEAASTGLAWGSSPPARAHFIGALLTWTALNTNPERTLDSLIDVGEKIQASAFPEGNILREIVATLGSTIRGVVPAGETTTVMTRLLGSLSEDRARESLGIFVADPPSEPGPPRSAQTDPSGRTKGHRDSRP